MTSNTMLKSMESQEAQRITELELLLAEHESIHSKTGIFYLEMILRMIEKTLRKRQPYDSIVRTDRVCMPRFVFDRLFGSLPNYISRRKIYGSDRGREKQITSLKEFKKIFNCEMPMKLFKAPYRLSKLKLPLVLFYCDKGVSGCAAAIQFNIYNSIGGTLKERRSKKRGESKNMVATRKAFVLESRRTLNVDPRVTIHKGVEPPGLRRPQRVEQVSVDNTIRRIGENAPMAPGIQPPTDDPLLHSDDIGTQESITSIATPVANRRKRKKPYATPPSSKRLVKKRNTAASPDTVTRPHRTRRLPSYLLDHVLD